MRQVARRFWTLVRTPMSPVRGDLFGAEQNQGDPGAPKGNRWNKVMTTYDNPSCTSTIQLLCFILL